MKTERKYASDLTDRQWQLIRQLLWPRWRRGRRSIHRRRIINAILYVVRTGCHQGSVRRLRLRSLGVARLDLGNIRLDSANGAQASRRERIRGTTETVDR